MTVNDAVAKRISKLLKEKGISQYRLEQESGIQHGSMQCIMNGRNKTVTLSTILMISKGFGNHGVFFVLFTPFASVCNHFYPFPSPRSPRCRPEHSKHENNIPWRPVWHPMESAMVVRVKLGESTVM